MRFISSLLILCFSFNVMSSTGTIQELEKALDNYQYSMTVEWDQKDQAFVAETTEEFYSSVSELMDRGLTQQDLMSVIAKKVRHPKDLEALKIHMSTLIGKTSTTSELAQVIAQNSKNLYANGASWDGSVIITGAVVVAIVGILGYAIWFDTTHTCVAYERGTQCGWTSYYYDGPQYWQCWPTTYCVQYVKN
jgi:hypothetical protein